MRDLVTNSKFCGSSYVPSSVVRAPAYINLFYPPEVLWGRFWYSSEGGAKRIHSSSNDRVPGRKLGQAGSQVHALTASPSCLSSKVPDRYLARSRCILRNVLFSLHVCSFCSTVVSYCLTSQCIFPSPSTFLLNKVLFNCLYV